MRKIIFKKQQEKNVQLNDKEHSLYDKKDRHRIKAFMLNSICAKLVVLFIILIVFPVLSVSYVAINTSGSQLIDKAKESLSNATAQTINYYEITLKQIEQGYVSQIAFDEAVTDYIRTGQYKNSVEKTTIIDSALKTIRRIRTTYENAINGAIIIKSNDEAISYPSNVYDKLHLTETGWYKRIVGSEKGIWLEEHNEGLPSSYNSEYLLSYGIPLKNSNDGKQLGTLVLDIKEDVFKSILSSVQIGENARSYAILGEKKVIGGISRKFENWDLNVDKNPIFKKAAGYASNNMKMVFRCDYSGSPYLVSFKKSKITGWIFVTVIPEKEVVSVINIIRLEVIVIGLIFIVMAVLIGILVSLSITKDIKKLKGSMERIEIGDLRANVSLKRTDEIGSLSTSFNKMIMQIGSLVSQSRSISVELSSSSDRITAISSEASQISSQIAETIREITDKTVEQAKESERSVGIVSALARKINEVVEDMKSIGSLSEEMQSITSAGIQTSGKLIERNTETDDITSEVVTKIDQLDMHINGINKVTDILKNISEQTKLLALNAAIESARAGEAGKGFAVVTHEIRKLAEQSSQFTREIEQSIKCIIAGTKDTKKAVSETRQAIIEQSGAVQHTADMFYKISMSTRELLEKIYLVSNSIFSIGEYKEEVFSSIQSISVTSEQTAAVTQEICAASEEYVSTIRQLDKMATELNHLSQDLTGKMDKFKYVSH